MYTRYFKIIKYDSNDILYDNTYMGLNELFQSSIKLNEHFNKLGYGFLLIQYDFSPKNVFFYRYTLLADSVRNASTLDSVFDDLPVYNKYNFNIIKYVINNYSRYIYNIYYYIDD